MWYGEKLLRSSGSSLDPNVAVWPISSTTPTKCLYSHLRTKLLVSRRPMSAKCRRKEQGVGWWHTHYKLRFDAWIHMNSVFKAHMNFQASAGPSKPSQPSQPECLPSQPALTIAKSNDHIKATRIQFNILSHQPGDRLVTLCPKRGICISKIQLIYT